MKRYDLLCFGLLLAYLLYPAARTVTQESESRILVVVNMVQLNVAVTDEKGNYVTGLRPEDFTVFEDGIPERIATFGEGNEPTIRLPDIAGGNPLIEDIKIGSGREMPQAAANDDRTSARFLRCLDLLHQRIDQFGPKQIIRPIDHRQYGEIAAIFARHQRFVRQFSLPFTTINLGALDITAFDRRPFGAFIWRTSHGSARELGQPPFDKIVRPGTGARNDISPPNDLA